MLIRKLSTRPTARSATISHHALTKVASSVETRTAAAVRVLSDTAPNASSSVRHAALLTAMSLLISESVASASCARYRARTR